MVGFQWEDEGSGSQWPVVQFARFLEERDFVKREKLKNNFLGYNRDDVLATKSLEEWLRGMSDFPQSSLDGQSRWLSVISKEGITSDA